MFYKPMNFLNSNHINFSPCTIFFSSSCILTWLIRSLVLERPILGVQFPHKCLWLWLFLAAFIHSKYSISLTILQLALVVAKFWHQQYKPRHKNSNCIWLIAWKLCLHSSFFSLNNSKKCQIIHLTNWSGSQVFIKNLLVGPHRALTTPC